MASLATYPLLFIFALAPSFIWLAFYLRKDSHPEPNGMIIKIFIAGMLITIPAIYLETFLEGFLASFNFSRAAFLVLYFFIGISFVEEFLKFLVVRIGVFRSSVLDEPLDIMLYMVISALGFAAFENTLLLFRLVETYPLSDIFLVNSIRFVQAIFLHALASGILGYFVARSLVFKKNRVLFFITGLTIAVTLHAVFNLYIFIIGDQGLFLLLLPIAPLLLVAVFVSFGFRQLKKLKPSSLI
jgi:protease PrsW